MPGYTRWTAFREAGLWIAAIPVLAPVYFVVATAFKTPGEAAARRSRRRRARRPPTWPRHGSRRAGARSRSARRCSTAS
ncbi:hypothetical protein LUX57_50090 [Actinomadura madurae]|uniref:hypothetical protein n=1 Tax=Actinomadura madurae TaxID=1993 RepID=UPI0020D24CAF|nr:hypothetical protein [Actinomadura madurae]MCP9972238.1 hypothetical protein [Actinomadura madurae]